MKLVLIGLALFFIVATGLSLVRYDGWWVRVFDFPRGQIALSGVVILVIYLITWDVNRLFEGVVLVALFASVAFQCYRMYPYTPLASKQVLAVEGTAPDSTLSLMVANVLMDNREAQAFRDLVAHYDPDIILTVETDEWWQNEHEPLREGWPYTMEKPLDNTYGMLLFSRLELLKPEVKYLIEDSIPSFHAQVRLRSGHVVWLHAVHPEPPNPKWATTTTERDAELLVIGQTVKDRDAPTIVAGDLNDVAWSYTTQLFQKVSGLLDPRVGRGMYNTFNAKNVLMRWPLDHVFHSDHFKLVELERGPAWGSDHFPVFIKLALIDGAEIVQEEPDVTQEEEEVAEEKIEKAVNEQEE